MFLLSYCFIFRTDYSDSETIEEDYMAEIAEMQEQEVILLPKYVVQLTSFCQKVIFLYPIFFRKSILFPISLFWK